MMKTAFDAALRVRRRELDEIRIRVATQHDMVNRLDDARHALDEQQRAEAELARQAESPLIDFGAFARRMHREAEALEMRRIAAQQKLDGLLDQARAAFGDYKAVDQAAEHARAAARLERARREQAHMDEIAMRGFTDAAREPSQ